MDNKEVIPELYNFLLPHLHQQNINEGMNIILKLNDCIKSLEHKTDLLTTRLEYLTKENELLRPPQWYGSISPRAGSMET